MSQVVEEMNSILMHYGTPRHSGRYPWGSGENPYQRNGDFLSRVDELKGQGLSDTEIAKAMGLTTTQFRTQRSLAKDERRALEVERAKALQSDGYNPSEIARIMGYNNESSIRSLLNSDSEARMNQARVTAENLKRQVDEHGMIAISAGTERYLTNPTVKKVLLQSFADDCDAAAVHLKAASLPRQKYKVILPITSMKDDEVYAPGYENGEKVALIRFPHGGTFEIPVLTVNNKQAEAKSKLGLAKDAVGINSKVAERLSGADFDRYCCGWNSVCSKTS